MQIEMFLIQSELRGEQGIWWDVAPSPSSPYIKNDLQTGLITFTGYVKGTNIG